MKNSHIKNHVQQMGMSILALGLSCAAMAQTGTTAPGADSSDVMEGLLEEVIVTAQRRTESLQTTSISASVLAGDDLEKLGVSMVDQLQFAVPSLVVNNFGQGIDFNIRGIGKAEHNTQTTTGVITYRDGVATFPGYFTAEPYYDIATLEVLRGPQGTFVGQNATGGAVFVTSNNPVIGGEHDGYIQGQIGNYSNLGAQGAINLPVSDTFAARIAFYTEQRDSFYDITGPYTGDDGVQINAVRVGLLWEPTEALSVLFKTDVDRLDLSAYNADPYFATNDIFDITANADLYGRDKFWRSILNVEYEFSGGTRLRSVSGFQDGNTAYRADLDGTSIGNSIFRDSVDETIFSQEFNLISSDDKRLRWVLGAYYQDDEYDFLPGEFVIGVPEGSPFTEYRLEGTNPKTAESIFGHVTFDLTERLELEVGARYSEHETTNHISVVQYGLPIQQDQSAEYTNTSGKVALNWTANDNNYVYGFVATGFRPGGLNVPVGLGLPDPFDEEEVESYEIGWKAIWADGHLRTQFSAFHNNYDGFQVIIGYPQIPVFGFQLNTPETTTITGFEGQLQAVFGNFSVDGGFGVISSELGTFYATDPRIPAFGACDPISGPESASCINLDGRDQTYAPDFTFNIGAQYDFTLSNGTTITPRLNYAHISEQWATLFQNEARGDLIEARNIFSGQIAWVLKDYVVTLYGTNLTDEHYVGALNSGLRFGAPPLQYGLRVRYSF